MYLDVLETNLVQASEFKNTYEQPKFSGRILYPSNPTQQKGMARNGEKQSREMTVFKKKKRNAREGFHL